MDLEKAAKKLGIGKPGHHIFLCCGKEEGGCCKKEEGLATWNYLKKRIEYTRQSAPLSHKSKLSTYMHKRTHYSGVSRRSLVSLLHRKHYRKDFRRAHPSGDNRARVSNTTHFLRGNCIYRNHNGKHHDHNKRYTKHLPSPKLIVNCLKTFYR